MSYFKIIISTVDLNNIPEIITSESKTSCIFTMARNLEPSKIQFGVGVVSIN